MSRREFPHQFETLTEREMFELVWKSNQLEEEYDPAFAYLPAPDTSQLWRDHVLFLDETIDAYNIVMIFRDGNLTFMWENWRLGTAFKSCRVPLEAVLKTMRQMIVHCLNHYPELRTGTPDWLEDAASFMETPR